LCRVEQVPPSPPLASTYAPLLDPKAFPSPCVVDWAPLASLPAQLLVADDGQYSENGETRVFRVAEGTAAPGASVLTVGDYARVIDARWLPDGSGFVLARWGGLLDVAVNLFEYTFGSAAPRQITSFTGEYVRRFAISPDGQRIVFERVSSLDGPSDLWVVGRDGSNPTLLIRDAAFAAWNPRR